jgi:L-lactate dehydrogenase complex protein LldE
MRPSIGFAAIELLEKAGCSVYVPPGQTCCGQPGYNSGDRAGALALAKKVVADFEGCDYLVAPSGSCSGTIKTHYGDLFRDAPNWQERAERLMARTYELSDFLVNVAKIETVPGRFEGRITYHDSCAGLREMGVKRQPRALLAKMPGVALQEMQESEMCCGFGGTFSVKYGEISGRMADNKCKQIEQCQVDAVVLGDLGCILNIEGKLRRRGDTKTKVLHFAEVLTYKGNKTR